MKMSDGYCEMDNESTYDSLSRYMYQRYVAVCVFVFPD